MSKAYAEKFGATKPTREQLRAWLRPVFPVDKDGKPEYVTEQAHKNECDVNRIIKKYDKTGLITHISQFNAEYGDLTGVDFKSAQDLIASVKQKFEALPNQIRRRFANDPHELVSFMNNPANRDEAVKLGLIRGDWTESTDGMGEKVPSGGNVVKPVEKKTEIKP